MRSRLRCWGCLRRKYGARNFLCGNLEAIENYRLYNWERFSECDTPGEVC
jgi:hypothetical protein